MFFEAAAGSSQPEYLLRPAARDILGKIEAGKILTDNLVGAVALDLFGPGVPSDNPALRVHHDDRVVPYFVEEHPISFLAVLKRLLGAPAPGAVAPDAPTCSSGDQQTQDGSEDQNGLGLVNALLRVCFACRQQPELFVLHLTNDCLKIIGEQLARSVSYVIRGRLQSLLLTKTDHHFTARDPLGRQPFDV